MKPLAVLAALLSMLTSAGVFAQQPNTPFALIGSIENLELCPGTQPCDRTDKFAPARIRVNGVWATLPRNLKIVMPGTYMTAQELFANKPGTPAGSVAASSGLATQDADSPRRAVFADLLGNVVDGEYVVGLASISPAGPLQIASGYITAIEHTTGTLTVSAKPNGTAMMKVRLNDPEGRFGRAQSADPRFQVDNENPTVHAMTGYPVCIPRTVNSAQLSTDPECPSSNRLGTATRFTAGPRAAAADAPACASCDPRKMVPLIPGDLIIFAGLWVDADGGYLSASMLEANLAVYTSPGDDPAYVAVEESIWGTGGTPFPGLDQETGPGKVVPGQNVVTRFRIVGFTTDPSRNVEVRSVRIDPNSGGECPVRRPDEAITPGVCRSLLLSSVQPEPNAPIGRFRVTVDRSVFLPPTREIRVQVAGHGNVTAANGLEAGQYTAPVGEYIFPEGRSWGKPPVPMNFEDLCFLSKGEGSGADAAQRLVPFPTSAPSRSASGAICN